MPITSQDLLRTGEGLYVAIRRALKEASLDPLDIDYISAHGTATDYNDEMEAKALSWAGLERVPVNSFKGYFGHTLGAAGIIESALAIDSMRNNELFRSAGFENPGTSKHINILTDHIGQGSESLFENSLRFWRVQCGCRL